MEYNGSEYNGLREGIEKTKDRKSKDANRILYTALEEPLKFEEIGKLFFPKENFDSSGTRRMTSHKLYKRGDKSYGSLGWLIDKKFLNTEKIKPKTMERKNSDGSWKKIRHPREKLKKIQDNAGKNYPIKIYDLNFEKLIDIWLKNLLGAASIKYGESGGTIPAFEAAESEKKEFENIKNKLCNCFKEENVRKNLFSHDKWSFLFFEEDGGFNLPFESVFGLLNFIAILYALKFREENVQTASKKTYINLFERKLCDLMKRRLLKKPGLTVTKTLDFLDVKKKIEVGEEVIETPILSQDAKDVSQRRKEIKEKSLKKVVGDVSFNFDEELANIFAELYGFYFNFDNSKKFCLTEPEEFYAMIEDGVKSKDNKLVSESNIRLSELFHFDVHEKVRQLFGM